MLDQILADPADDTLKLVYADQLLAAGDARGEYIVVDERMASAPRGSSERAALAQRRAELRREHAASWWPELPERRIGTRLGFAERIAVFASELGVVPAIAGREPIAALELLDYPRRARPAHAPWQRRIRRLAVRGELTWEDLVPLWEGPLGDAVEELVLASRSFTFGRQESLGSYLPRCRTLCLAGSRLEDVALDSPLRELLRWDHVARLEVLDLAHCSGLGGAAIHALLSLELSALRVLRLSGNPIGDDGALALASHLRAFPALSRIELLDARIGERGVEALRGAETRAEIVLDAIPPSRIALDAVGIELELFQVNESEWGVAFDGVRRPIRIRMRGPRHEAIDTIAERAMLGPVVRALSTGASRRIRTDTISVQVGRHEHVRLTVAPDRSELLYEP